MSECIKKLNGEEIISNSELENENEKLIKENLRLKKFIRLLKYTLNKILEDK